MARLEDTDQFVVQRVSEANDQGGHKLHNQYFVTADQIGNYCISYFAGGKFPNLEEDILQLKDVVDQLLRDYTTVINDLGKHQTAIVRLQEITEEHTQQIADINVRFDETLSKSKINIYYELVNNDAPDVGQMAVFKDNALATTFGDVNMIRYNVVDSNGTQNRFDNIWAEETLEVTCLNNVNSTLTHRAIYYLESYQLVDGKYFDCTVVCRNSNGVTNDLPFYDPDEDNVVRTDFYPLFTVQEDDILEKMEDYLPIECEDVPLRGKLSINDNDTRLNLWGENSSTIKFKKNLKINNRNSETLMEFGETTLNTFRTLNVNSKQIKNLSNPSEEEDAVNLRHLNDALKKFDVTQEDLFKPGDAVAATSSSRTEPMGFYYFGNSLYFLVSN